MTRKKKIYLCSPFAGNVAYNVALAKAIARHVILHEDVAPIIPHLLYPAVLDDGKPDERALGIDLDTMLVDVCDELWFYGTTITDGMKREIRHANEVGIPVKNRLVPAGCRQTAAKAAEAAFFVHGVIPVRNGLLEYGNQIVFGDRAKAEDFLNEWKDGGQAAELVTWHYAADEDF